MGLRKKKGTDGAPKDDKKGAGKDKGDKGGKKSLLPAVIVAVGLIGGGYFMGGGGAKASAGAVEATTTTTEAEGHVVAMDPVTLNLADGRFLKVGLGLRVSPEHAAGGDHGGGGDENLAATWAEALDAAIDVLGHRSYDELVSVEGRHAAKEELAHRLEEAYHGGIQDLYFTEFVMQ